MKTKIPCKFAVALALLPGLTASLLAQTAAPATISPGDSSEQPVVLETFTVNTDRDQGYIAVDSLAGGRQNTPLRVTPSAVSSLTKEFINDLAVTDLQDALQWSLNVTPTNFRSGNVGGTGGDTHNFWSVSVRGDAHVQGGNPPTKNYFPTFMIIDTYNVERIEINSGPNSILFGIGDIGGSLTTYTKVARFDKTFQDLTLRATSFGGYRVAGDVNQTVGNLAVRVNAVWADEKGWRDGEFDKRKGVTLAASYKFGDNTQLRFEIEGWRQERNLFAGTVTDGYSLWNSTASSDTWGVLPSDVGANPITTAGASGTRTMDAWGGPANYRVLIPGQGVMNWAGGARSAGLNDFYSNVFLRDVTWIDGQSGRAVPALPSREFAVAPPDSVLKPEALAGTVSFEHRFNENSEIQLQAYRYEDTAQGTHMEGAGGGLGYGVAIDLNRQLPNGQNNPNYGKKYSDFFLGKQNQNHRVNEYRGQYSFHFDRDVFNIPLKQSFSVSAGRQETDYDARTYQLFHAPTYNALTDIINQWTQAMVWGRVYWDQPERGFDVGSVNDVFYRAHVFNWYDFNSTQKITYGGIFSQTRLWDDRLNISMGGRRDSYKNRKQNIRGVSNPVTLAEDEGDTYSIGVVGYVLPWLGIVGNISSNFQPAAGGIAPGLNGEIFGPSFGKGRDIGVRVSTKDHKYYASVNYYNTKATDVIGAETPGFQAIWTEYLKAGGTKTDIGPAGTISGLSAQMNFNDTYAVEYKGVEVELVANPTPNIRLQAHYSKPKGEKTDSAPGSREYWAKHIDDWRAVAPLSTQLSNLLTEGQRNLDTTAMPSITSRLPTSQWNAFATYTFLDGPLDGLGIGGGVTAFGEQYGFPWESVNGERTKNPSYETFSFLLSYTRKFNLLGRSTNARFQLNVDNVLDEDKLIFTNYQTYGTNQIQGGNYRYLNPRRFTFTANFGF